jgi:hypothetical protein
MSSLKQRMNASRLPEFKFFTHAPVEFQELKDETGSDGTRFYLTPGGKRYPSITTVLSLLSKKNIAAWRRRVGEDEANRISGKAVKRGTKIHSLCEKYLNNSYHNQPPELFGDDLRMFLSLKDVIDENIDGILAQEVTLYSHYLEMGGRLDLAAHWKGEPAIIDFKTSSKPKQKNWITNYFMQGAGYSYMWQELTGQHISKIVIIIAVDGGRVQIFEVDKLKYIGGLITAREEYRRAYDV